jgi:hypothetical protein
MCCLAFCLFQKPNGKLKQDAAQPPKQGPKRLLAIEVFAGSHPVGCHFQELRLQALQQQQQQLAPYSLAAYAAVELQDGQQFKAPEAKSLGLAPTCHLDLHGDVQEPAVQAKLLEFVRKQLKASALDEVVVFGGPPCTEYSNANVHKQKHKKDLKAAQEAFADVAKQLRALRHVLASTRQVSIEMIEDIQCKVDKARSEWQARKTALEEVLKDEEGARQADAVVSSFLKLFKDIQQAAGNTPCHLVMENPYSATSKALWDRCVIGQHGQQSHCLQNKTTTATA